MESNFQENELYNALPNLQLFSQHIRSKTVGTVFTSPQQSVELNQRQNDSQKKSSDPIFVDTKNMQNIYDGLRDGSSNKLPIKNIVNFTSQFSDGAT